MLHRIDFVENMGTGINKIQTLLKEAGASSAEFEFGNFYTITFPRIKTESQTVVKTSVKKSEEIIEFIRENMAEINIFLNQKLGGNR